MKNPQPPGDPDVLDQVTISRRRLVDKDVAASYLGVSTNTIERLIQTGALQIVRFPVERSKKPGANGDGQVGTNRRVLIDVRDLNELIERSKEKL
jgi:hypothetical protein